MLIEGAGVVEFKFFTTVNVTDVKVHGTATRGEKIDRAAYQFEGELRSPVVFLRLSAVLKCKIISVFSMSRNYCKSITKLIILFFLLESIYCSLLHADR